MKTCKIAKTPIFNFFGQKVGKGGIFGKYDDIVYICEDFRPIIIRRNNCEFKHYRVRIYDAQTDTFKRIKTCDNARYYKLSNHITKSMVYYHIPCDFVTKCIDKRIVGQPREKMHQVYSDSPFKINYVGYALNSRIITNGSAGWADWKD